MRERNCKIQYESERNTGSDRIRTLRRRGINKRGVISGTVKKEGRSWKRASQAGKHQEEKVRSRSFTKRGRQTDRQNNNDDGADNNFIIISLV